MSDGAAVVPDDQHRHPRRAVVSGRGPAVLYWGRCATTCEVDVRLVSPRQTGDPRTVGRRPRRFVLEHRIAEGGFGVVYLARYDGRPAAVKVMRPGRDPLDDTQRKERFEREVDFLAELRHPRVPGLLDRHLGPGDRWLAVRYVPAPTLYDLVQECGPLPAAAAAWLAGEIADVLVEVHDIGVHRDVKAGNVLVALDGAELIDFSIAQRFGAPPLTESDKVIGTWDSMADERLFEPPARRGSGEPADVYGLGSVLLYALTGRPARTQRRVRGERPDLTGVPAALREVVQACLAPSAAARPTADELRRRLAPSGDSFLATLRPVIAATVTAAVRAVPGLPARGRTRAHPVPGGAGAGPRRATAPPPRHRPPAPHRRPPTSDLLGGDAVRWHIRVDDWVRSVTELPDAGILVVTAEGGVLALEGRDGTPRWSQRLPAGPSGPVVVAGGLVHVAGGDDRVRTFDAGNGRPRPAVTVGGPVTALATHGTGFVAAGAGAVVARPEARGGARWQFPAPPTVPDGLAAAGERVYVAGTDGVVRVLDAATGGLVGRTAAVGRVVGLVPVPGGRAVLATTTGGVRVRVEADGRSRRLPDAAPRAGAVSACRGDGRVAVTATSAGALLAEALDTGHLVFRRHAGASLRGSLGVRNGLAAVGTVAGGLEVRELRTGGIVRQLPPRDSALEASAALTGSGDVVAGWADGTVAALITAG